MVDTYNLRLPTEARAIVKELARMSEKSIQRTVLALLKAELARKRAAQSRRAA